MYRATKTFQPSAVTMLGGALMGTGALIWMLDADRTLRNVHFYVWPAFALMALGAVIAGASSLFLDRAS